VEGSLSWLRAIAWRLLSSGSRGAFADIVSSASRRAHNLLVRIERRTGSAGEFHAAPIPDPLPSAVTWVFQLDRPALVLGSGQREEVADAHATRAIGTEVVRRHSGGGAVLLVPGRCSWIDVLLPRHDPRWSDDVGTSAHWLGDSWASALKDLGVEAAVHRGALQKTTWGSRVCFAAVGPGEVIIGSRKVVGISQRRTRIGARFQCLVLDRWDPGEVLDLLALDPADRARAADELTTAATGPGVPLDVLEDAFITHLQ
jgi:lipoate-protein ligase A